VDRRQFLTIGTVGALGVIAAVRLSRNDGGTVIPTPSTAFDGMTFVHVHAGGGWDPTSLCDPKGRQGPGDGEPTNTWYETGEIEQVGNLRYAPLRDAKHPTAGRDFFHKHGQRLLVINGIDTSTRVQDRGARHMACGYLEAGYPSFGALYAAVTGDDLPLAYLTFGGYDETVGLVTRTRSGTTNALALLAPPDPTVSASKSAAPDALNATERLMGSLSRLHPSRVDPALLARAREALGDRFAKRTRSARFDDLGDHLPARLDTSDNPLIRQAQIAMAAARAGLTTACNLYIGGFDTYNRHDDTHVPRLIQLLEGVDFLWEEAGRQGIQDRLVITCGSGCGRAPYYNDRDGKDDWPVTSMMLMGRGIPGNRVIGATDERYSALPLDPATLAPDPEGVRLEPRHVHQSLRRLAGIDASEVSARFPLHVPPTEELPLFG
jgi:hypothetical protein